MLTGVAGAESSSKQGICANPWAGKLLSQWGWVPPDAYAKGGWAKAPQSVRGAVDAQRAECLGQTSSTSPMTPSPPKSFLWFWASLMQKLLLCQHSALLRSWWQPLNTQSRGPSASSNAAVQARPQPARDQYHYLHLFHISDNQIFPKSKLLRLLISAGRFGSRRVRPLVLAEMGLVEAVCLPGVHPAPILRPPRDTTLPAWADGIWFCNHGATLLISDISCLL